VNMSKFALLAIVPALCMLAPCQDASALEPGVVLGLVLDAEHQQYRVENPDGAEIVLFGGGHRLVDTVTYSETRGVQVTDGDADGEIVVESERPLPEVGAFLAVDIATGAIAAASPGQEPRLADFPPATFSAGESPEALLLHVGRSRLLLVRPGVGAWQLTNLEQNASGAMNASAPLMESLGASPSPAFFQEGDVLALYDPVAVTVAVHRIRSSELENGSLENDSSDNGSSHQGGNGS